MLERRRERDKSRTPKQETCETIKDAQQLQQDTEQGLQSSAQKVVECGRTFRKNTLVWKTQVKGEKASDAGSVQQGSVDTSCCEGIAAGMQLRRFVEQEDAVTTRCPQSSTGERGSFVGTTQRRGGRTKSRSRRTAHRASCSRRNESGTVTSYANRMARQALG